MDRQVPCRQVVFVVELVGYERWSQLPGGCEFGDCGCECLPRNLQRCRTVVAQDFADGNLIRLRQRCSEPGAGCFPVPTLTDANDLTSASETRQLAQNSTARPLHLRGREKGPRTDGCYLFAYELRCSRDV